ncbi:aromatic prenyltransferase [Lophiostoma macrostomum CBS 122681]|uniref:Aromatic prenyltransferase n=1 Tax=Lophiostoma macrostomum CBS 122681 TaxID=1314788 RepID=A0A6A6TAV7_9PLEO|nr:aromatic prenyltransferase [Lophiostoma macrostomum CBS 122681]
MMQYAGYSDDAQQLHESTLDQIITAYLGPHPEGPNRDPILTWKSFMNDDHTPIEFSWSWRLNSLPTMRCGMEVIVGDGNGSSASTEEALNLVGRLARQDPSINLEWCHHFADTLLSGHETLPRAGTIGCPSEMFLALEFLESRTGLKVYYIPADSGVAEDVQGLRIIRQSLQGLPHSTARLLGSFDMIQKYLYSAHGIFEPRVEMLAIDCIAPENARIKIYIRSPKTSFASVKEMMSLGRRLGDMPDPAMDSLRMLWSLMLGPGLVASDDQELPCSTHRTSGMIYHFSIRVGKELPTCKLYIPVKHYARDDAKVAEGLDSFLRAHGMHLQGIPYSEAATQLCSHRRLADGLGFHTYISAEVDGESLAVSSYIQPEIYRPTGRR